MSALEQTRTRLEQIARKNPTLCALVRVDGEEALAAARVSDERHAGGTSRSVLDGLVTAVKDNLAVADKPWAAGIAGRRNLVADMDAAAVAQLRTAGAVLIGSTNMDEAALGATTDNAVFGRCVNPLGSGLTPGGSSGGSAAAVAAGFVDLALGTDTMGSVRLPAAYCGIAAIKPTFGAIDREGLAMLCPSLDTIGPMARDVRLLWPALEVLASTQANQMWLEPTKCTDLAGLRFGVPKQLALVDCQTPVLAGLKRAADAITQAGGSVHEIVLPEWSPHAARRAGLLIIENEGAQCLADLIERPDAISDHLRAMLVFGRDASAEKLAAARTEIARAGGAVDRALTEVDAILMPTTPQRAFAHGTPVPANQADLTAPANFAGCPSVALPVALPGETLPGSVQLIARRWADASLLQWAGLLADMMQTDGSVT